VQAACVLLQVHPPTMQYSNADSGGGSNFVLCMFDWHHRPPPTGVQ